MPGSEHLEFARSVIRHEAAALDSLVGRLGESFCAAVEVLLACQGRVVVTGIGKARLIGQKISATLASTGTPSFDLHAGEALHGDLGRMCPGDVVIALSNSGKTREIRDLIDPLKKWGLPLIAITGRLDSPLAQHADYTLHIGDLDEACPLGLAPSTTTTAMLALGDALALTVQRAKHFDAGQYAFFHPAGSLGRQLMKVSKLMRVGDDAPTIHQSETVRSFLTKTASCRAGAYAIVDDGGLLVGVFTNGDLRRYFSGEPAIETDRMAEVMTKGPKTIGPGRLASEAFALLKEYEIDELPVVDEAGRSVGMIDIQDYLSLSR